jgi:hypothetical protein
MFLATFAGNGSIRELGRLDIAKGPIASVYLRNDGGPIGNFRGTGYLTGA